MFTFSIRYNWTLNNTILNLYEVKFLLVSNLNTNGICDIWFMFSVLFALFFNQKLSQQKITWCVI